MVRAQCVEFARGAIRAIVAIAEKKEPAKKFFEKLLKSLKEARDKTEDAGCVGRSWLRFRFL